MSCEKCSVFPQVGHIRRLLYLQPRLDQCDVFSEMSSEDGHSVSILDAHGKRVEWNGEDYVEEGSTCSRSETRSHLLSVNNLQTSVLSFP